MSQFVTTCITLFFMPFMHEDVAIVTGAFFITQDKFPVVVAYACLYSGIIASDLMFYGLGMFARRFAWAQRLLIKDKVKQIRARLDANLITSVAIVRVVPGILAPTFLACGWFGLSFRIFLFTTMTAAAIYLAVMLTLVVSFGNTLLPMLGHWGWVVLLVLILTKTFIGWLRKPQVPKEKDPPVELYSKGIFAGLPKLPRQAHSVALAERLPEVLVYLPLFLSWLLRGLRYLSFTLPTVANPLIRAGGLWGESKTGLLASAQEASGSWIAPFFGMQKGGVGNDSHDLAQLLRRIEEAGLHYPLVMKPDVGWQGYGVRKVEKRSEVEDYLVQFPPGETLMVQQVVPWAGEAGVYYMRMPGEPRGHIISLTFRYVPHVVGDGEHSVQELIKGDRRTLFKSALHLGRTSRHRGLPPSLLASVPGRDEVVPLAFIGSLRTGGMYRDARRFITPDLEQRFDAIARAMPEFYFGRFDVRFHSLDELQRGEGFSIIEINGAGSEPIHAWDPQVSIFTLYRELFHFQSMLFKVAAANRRRGYRPMSALQFLRLTRGYARLLKRYPASS
jgi:membrane protein DedA with SNARE-associated domain